MYAYVDKMLSDDDAEVAALSKQLKDANRLMDKAVTEMGNMNKVIDDITGAVTIGAALAAKIP